MRLSRIFTVIALALPGAVLLPAQNSVSLTVDSTMDIYRAGGYNDGSDGIPPVVFSFPARAGRTMNLTSAGGAWSCQSGNPGYGADGETSGFCLSTVGPVNFKSVGPFSGYHSTDFTGALAAVFLSDTLPASAPPALRFYVSNAADGGIQTSFRALVPQLGQVFFIGDGLTGTGTGSLQTILVPPAATHLYLGYVANCKPPNNAVPGCYSGNVGSLNVTVRLENWIPDWIEPTLPSSPSARIGAAMAYDAATNSTVLFGGSGAFVPDPTYADTWIWRNGWTQVFPATSPPARESAGMAYDASTGTVVLFGGWDNSNNGVALGDTWIWDGVTWTQQFPARSPSPRYSRQTMAYDPATQTVVLFGGYGSDNGNYGGTPFGDTWEWNGRTKTWTQVFPSSSPSPRWAPLAYDAATRSIVLFGGENGGGDCCRIYYNDTWTWNGLTWTKQSPAASPTPRAEQSMAYDAGLGEVVVFGGTAGPPVALNDTWAWNGATWRQLNLLSEPSARYISDMAYDPLGGGLVLFGGELTGDIATNNTWLFFPVPIP